MPHAEELKKLVFIGASSVIIYGVPMG